MEFYQVLEKRRTVRDFSDRKVDDEVLKRILGAAFKAPTNDHLRQFEFVVVRGQERIGGLSRRFQRIRGIFSRRDSKLPGIRWTGTSMPCSLMRCPSNSGCLCRAVALFCRFSVRKIVRCAALQIKVRSTISLQRGRLWKIFCWQRRRKDWPARFVYRSVMSRNMSSGWSALLTDMSSPAFLPSAMLRKMRIYASRKSSV